MLLSGSDSISPILMGYPFGFPFCDHFIHLRSVVSQQYLKDFKVPRPSYFSRKTLLPTQKLRKFFLQFKAEQPTKSSRSMMKGNCSRICETRRNAWSPQEAEILNEVNSKQSKERESKEVGGGSHSIVLSVWVFDYLRMHNKRRYFVRRLDSFVKDVLFKRVICEWKSPGSTDRRAQ